MSAVRYLFVVALIPLAGCVSVLPEAPKPPRIYTMSAASSPVGVRSEPSSLVLAVAAPNGARALMGAEMVWRTNGVIAYVDQVEWAGRTPDLLQALLVDTLDAQGLVRGGVRAGSGVRADYEIQWDIAAFEIHEHDGRLEAHMGGTARLVETRTRELIATLPFDRVAPLSERSTGLAAAALESLARDVASDIARSLYEAASDHTNAASSLR